MSAEKRLALVWLAVHCVTLCWCAYQFIHNTVSWWQVLITLAHITGVCIWANQLDYLNQVREL